VAVPVLVSVKLYEGLVLATTVSVAPSGVTDAAGFATVMFHFPVADAPVGLVEVTDIVMLPAPAVPAVNVAVTVLT